MSQITAVLKCQKQAPTAYGTNVSFYPSYGPEENKAWADATPSAMIMLTVKNDVADKFEAGAEYLLTFQKREVSPSDG